MAANLPGRQSPEVFTRVLLVWSQVMTVWYLRLQWRSILARMETSRSMSPYTKPIIRIITITTRIWLYVRCVLCLSTVQYEGQLLPLRHMHEAEGYGTVSLSLSLFSKGGIGRENILWQFIHWHWERFIPMPVVHEGRDSLPSASEGYITQSKEFDCRLLKVIISGIHDNLGFK